MIWPELTTVRRPISDMAREAVRLLIEQVRAKRSGAAQAVEHKLLNFTLVTRESTVSAPPAKRKAKH
jgi:LacI family transcriptional regulator